MNSSVSQTRSFTTVFLIEMWERFGYYGMQALIVYYMVQRLGFTDDRANLVWGAAAALIYVAPAIGGWIGDKVLGTRRTMLIGAVVLAAGYSLMVVPGENTWYLFLALGVIVVGNGLFKANAGNLVRKIYEGDDSKIDSAFTIYYMAVNLGAMISQLATPVIKDYVNDLYHNDFGWHAAFAICAFGLVLGLLFYAILRQSMAHIGSPPDAKPMDWGKFALVALGGVAVVFASAFILDHREVARAFVYLAGVVVLGIFGYLIAIGRKEDRRSDHIFRGAGAAERGVIHEGFYQLRIGGAGIGIQGCGDEAGSDRVDANAFLAEFGRERAGETEHAVLRGGVGR